MIFNNRLGRSLFYLGAILLPSSCTDLAPSAIVRQEPVMGDYFPLRVGNTWVYDFRYLKQDGPVVYTRKNGVSRWTIIDSSAGFELMSFGLLCVDSGSSTQRDALGRVTSGPFRDSILIQIIEDKNHFVTLFHPGTKWEILRFNPITRGDTITTENTTPFNNGTLSFVRSVGLASAHWIRGDNHHYIDEIYQLIDVMIP